jgi:hypothetical protein
MKKTGARRTKRDGLIKRISRPKRYVDPSIEMDVGALLNQYRRRFHTWNEYSDFVSNVRDVVNDSYQRGELSVYRLIENAYDRGDVRSAEDVLKVIAPIKYKIKHFQEVYDLIHKKGWKPTKALKHVFSKHYDEEPEHVSSKHYDEKPDDYESFRTRYYDSVRKGKVQTVKRSSQILERLVRKKTVKRSS